MLISKSFHSPLSALVAVVTTVVCAFASSAAMSQTNVSSGDSAFMKKSAIGGMAEVELGKLAQQKGASEQVKEFGAHMVNEHSNANAELKQLAAAKGVVLPTALDDKHQKIVDRLQKLSGEEFDRAYMKEMVSDHKKDVAEFQKQSKNGKDAEVKAFAAKTLPTLEKHYKMAQSGHKMAQSRSPNKEKDDSKG